jgi:hypothetical protein
MTQESSGIMDAIVEAGSLVSQSSYLNYFAESRKIGVIPARYLIWLKNGAFLVRDQMDDKVMKQARRC